MKTISRRPSPRILRAGINARWLAAPSLRGINRYAVNLLARLPAHGVELVLYTADPVHADHLSRLPPGSYLVRRPERLLRYTVWEQLWLPRQLAADRVDLYHAPGNYGIPLLAPCPLVLTLHDAIDPVYYGRKQSPRVKFSPAALASRFRHWSSRMRADRVIAVSRHAASDLQTFLGVPPRKTTVTYEAADDHFRPPTDGAVAAVREKYGLPRRYVFYVGGWEGRKNVPFLVSAFAAAGLKGVGLVLAGGNAEQTADLKTLAERLGIADRLTLCGWIDDADLPALYGGADCFVYPSEYEGFGLQLCEAMACGTAVLAARASCLPEVLGAGGETFALGDTQELAGLLQKVCGDAAFRNGLRRRAEDRSKDFSWDRCAAETAAVFHSLVRGRE